MNKQPFSNPDQEPQDRDDRAEEFQLSDAFPLEEVFSPALYKRGAARFLLFFGLFPLAVSWCAGLLGLGTGLRDTAWLLGIYYACIWGVVLYALIKPVSFSWGKTLTCIVFTIVFGIPLGLLLQLLPPFNLLYAGIGRGAVPTVVGFVLGVGVLEEFIKALPVYLFLTRPGKVRDPLSASFYGAMSGLGFAISEGVNYSMQYAIGLGQEMTYSLLRMDQEILGSSIGAFLLISTIRFVCLPLFHAIWAGIFGYFLGLGVLNRSQQTTIIAIGWAIVAVLHGLYNALSENFLSLLVMAFSILLFLTYLRSSQKRLQMNEDS